MEAGWTLSAVFTFHSFCPRPQRRKQARPHPYTTSSVRILEPLTSAYQDGVFWEDGRLQVPNNNGIRIDNFMLAHSGYLADHPVIRFRR